MRIKKIAPVTPANGNIENSYGTSQENTYSQEYINNTYGGNSVQNFSYTTTNGIVFDFYKYGKVVELEIKGTATFTADTFYSVEIDPSLEPASEQFRSSQRIVESANADANAYITIVKENNVLVAKIRMKYSSSTATYPRAAVTYISK